MALMLDAKQQTIRKMFSGEKQYIIPPYQRAYSWEESACKELFEDLKNAQANSKDGYFLGNIVIAVSSEDNEKVEVIDGQQRLTTLTLLMKVLLEFDKDNRYLQEAINIAGERAGDAPKQRLDTDVFIKKDKKFLKEVISSNFSYKDCNSISKDNQFKKNICFFYNEINKYSKVNTIEDFIYFLLHKVILLPIETNNRETALKIFETMNDRGLSLSDSDIFKAKLYSNARNKEKSDDFIKKWNEFDENCSDIKNHIDFRQKNYIDEVFRTYTYTIRGEKGNKGNEMSLRDFFLQQDESPFKKMDYDEVLTDLSKIIDSIQFFGSVTKEPKKYKELTKWFQLINLYTNKYPLNILLVYLYKNGLEHTPKLENFVRELVRFSYGTGTAIDGMKKFMFDMSIKIMHDKELNFNIKSDNEYIYSYSGSLRKGLSLLALYLNPKQSSIFPYYFDKIIQNKDVIELDSSWNEKNIDELKERIGNVLILDLPKKNIKLAKKIEYLNDSSMYEIKKLLPMLKNWNYKKYEERNEELHTRLKEFFEVTNAN